MKRQHLAAGVYLLVTAFAVQRLWVFWTPLCNESCASSVIVAMYLTLCLALLAAIGISAFMALGKLSIRHSLYSVIALAMAIAAAAFVLTGIVRV